MNPAAFDYFKTMLYQRSGLVITPEKGYLLESRLSPVCKKNSFDNLDTLAQAMMKLPNAAVITEIVEAMTINETSFFRDMKPFQNFEQVILPYLLEKRAATKRVRIWCAASSSGQEPYSLAILLKEKSAQLAGWQFDIVASDISADILAQARAGVYSQFEVQRGLPIHHLMKYFRQDGDKWILSDDIKKMVRFTQFNLLDSMAPFGVLDVIFCRNVLIYFDDKTKTDIFKRLSAQMTPDGFLLLGGAETVIGLTQAFAPLPGRHGLYLQAGHPLLAADAQKAIASR